MSTKAKLLVVEDERLLRWAMRRKCEQWGYEVAEAGSKVEALDLAQREHPDLLLLDVILPDGNGVEMLTQLRQEQFTGPVIMITADPKVEDVKASLRQGAFDYLCKPVNFDELEITIANALEAGRLRREVETVREHTRRQFEHLEMVGSSPIMAKLMAFVERVASSEANAVLLQGESGTGKDLIAQILHQRSERRDHPFVPVNCSAIPESLLEAELFGHEKGAFTDAKSMKKGLFEMAEGGTIFLDEVGELPLILQSKLLRTLENQTLRRVGGVRDLSLNVRVIAASNRNLEQAVRAGEFRQDLYYRLGVIPIFIPPLRSRREDILALAHFFVEQYNRRFRKRIRGWSAEAEALLLQYAWPGNVRELKNAVQRAVILEDGELIQAQDLPFYAESGLLTSSSAFPAEAEAVGSGPGWHREPNGRSRLEVLIPSGGTSLEEIEKALVESALRQAHGNQSRAARLLDITRDVMRYKMKKFGLDGAEPLPPG
ncbi:MAG TPA: sigma-54 dependent transcriptional regulator [Terriglobales bacterium]|nr:sigma-54 dependent transcriptional regulator [Terriglobales bacterium]